MNEFSKILYHTSNKCDVTPEEFRKLEIEWHKKAFKNHTVEYDLNIIKVDLINHSGLYFATNEMVLALKNKKIPFKLLKKNVKVQTRIITPDDESFNDLVEFKPQRKKYILWFLNKYEIFVVDAKKKQLIQGQLYLAKYK